MGREKLQAQVREDRGTSKSKRLRRRGVVPGVLYGGGQETIHIGLDGKELFRVLHGKGGERALIDLQVAGGKLAKPLTKTVMVKEVQRDALKDAILHIDFAAISLTEKLQAKVLIVDVGEPAGVTQGGILEHIIRELTVECLPADLPDRISVDVSALEMGDSIKIGQIQAPPDVKILDDVNLTVFTVSAPKMEKVEEAPAEEEAAAAAEGAPAEGEEKAEEEKEGAKGKEKEAAKGKEKEGTKPKEKEPEKGKEKGKAKE